jgi:hypothetical protein
MARIPRCFLFLLLLSFAASAASIIVQPVIVGGADALDHRLVDYTYADIIYDQMQLDVTVLPELTSSTLPSTMDINDLATWVTDTTWQPGPILTVWYVGTIPGARGVSFGVYDGSGMRYGVAIADAHVNDTLAHEIGHVLLNFVCGTTCASGDPGHAADENNLVASGAIRNYPTALDQVYGNGGDFDQLTQSQINIIWDDETGFITNPEPGTMAICGGGVVLLFVLRRRRAA